MPRALARRAPNTRRTGDAPCCMLLTHAGIESESNSSTTVLHSSCHFATAKLGVSAPSASAAAASHQRRWVYFRRAYPPANSPTSQITPLLGHGTHRIRTTTARHHRHASARQPRPRRRPRLVGHQSPNPTPRAWGDRRSASPTAIKRPYLATGPHRARDIARAPPDRRIGLHFNNARHLATFLSYALPTGWRGHSNASEGGGQRKFLSG